MTIVVDSIEYKCWHEVGHAAVCHHLGDDVELIELLNNHDRGHAPTRSVVLPENHLTVAAAGMAAEVLLFRSGWAQMAIIDIRDHQQVIWHNAWADREDFRGRRLGPDEEFSEQENAAFAYHALNIALPIFDHYLAGMRAVVAELKVLRKVEGHRVRQLLRVGRQG